MVTPAQADPVSYVFTGTRLSTDGTADVDQGTQITGSLTLDPDQAPDFYVYDGDMGVWNNGAFTMNATTNSGIQMGNALGGDTQYSHFDFPDYSAQIIDWFSGYIPTAAGLHYRQILLQSFNSPNPEPGNPAVANPWTPLSDQFYQLEVREFFLDANYNMISYKSTLFSLDSFAEGVPNPSDTIAPTFTSLIPSTATLSSSNHKMVPITLSAAVTDNVGVVSTKIVSVTSNEADNGLGDGDTAIDFVITGDLSLSLRAERSGKGDGRVYTITVEAVDAAGNASELTTTVSVPKGKK
jgi:hypothetical protein